MALTRPRAAQIYNLDYKQATRAVATTNVTLAGGAPAVVDGVSLAVNDRVLCTGQSTGSQNLIYVVTTVGSGSNGTWTAATDDNTTGELDAGTIVMVTEGLVYADTQWKLITDNPITIGTTSLTWTQNYSANSISSGTSNVSVASNANVTISSAGTLAVLTVSSTGTVVKGTESITGNITGGNILTGGLVSATGNITGNYILGNGALLTGVITSVANINNGTSNVTVVSSGGNVTVGVGNTGNVTVFATTGEYVTGVVSASGNITGGNILTNGIVSSTGNITGGNISATNYTGTTVSVTGTVTAASTVGGIITGTSTSVTGNTTAGNVLTSGIMSSTGNATYGNVLTGGIVSATGNIAGNYILGNGSQLTGLPATYGNSNVATLLAGFGSNTVSTTGNITGGNLITSGLISAVGNLYLGTGNAGYIYGNGTFLTGISAAISVSKIENGNSNVWVQTAGGDVTVTAGGVSNVAVFSTGSLTVQGAIGTPKTISANVVIAGNINGILIGPVVFGNGVGMTVPTNSLVYVYTP